ncbi:MAG: DnaJ domain-containing protein [Treponema sp.]|nr:DnaJ domain-containing protein [Treponema sp.]
MSNYYELLSVKENASTQEIKRAFREQAKRLHPDIAGDTAAEQMRKLLAAYETLSDRNRRFEYDKIYRRFAEKYGGKKGFDYRSFLSEQKDDLFSQAKLIFFELLHLEEEAAITIWQELGGLDFPLERYLDREDWMDCSYILAEELSKRRRYYESFVLLIKIVREERQRPYFKHFMEDVEKFLKELVRLRLSSAVDPDTYAECIGSLLGLGFSPKDEERWIRSINASRQRRWKVYRTGQ